ncbi:putative PEP-binding protein [Actibacterium sp. 188UL27-1]|uniref:putative PEP-binding protein n=1 Tax=Actibacterium sp. 188UL27-1 TaxID=2786961 RepID=UPI00195A5084|nr:putative PEP-binding protein [Actibacterium sp. 188UL27-1]MBM7068757.1 pyruvate, phosphate dikinase [Actibacterium sp. 188UL27-1]
MQKISNFKEFTEVTPDAVMAADTHGGRAKCLQRLVRLDLPVPLTVSLPFDTVGRIAAGHSPDTAALLAVFGALPLVSVRPSSQDQQWGGPGALLNVGMNARQHAHLRNTHGDQAADALYLRFIQAYAVDVARLDPDIFDDPEISSAAVARALVLFEEEAETPFPQDPAVQLAEVLRSMARAWDSTSARLLRQARGAPNGAGLGLVVQRMALGFGPGESGSGVMQFINPVTGAPRIHGRYLRQSMFRDALLAPEDALFLRSDPRGPALEDVANAAFAELTQAGAICRQRLREEMEIEFTLENGQLHVLDAVRAARSTRAGLSAAVALAKDRVISEQEAVLRVAPQALAEMLHPQVDHAASRDVIARGIAGSPGGATGRLVFSAAAAQTSAAQGEPCILIRRETMPEDIRGMHVAQGILTERGGMTSHAAVIARGLGLPCVVGATGLRLSTRKKTLGTADGRVLREGDLVTLDGTSGELLAGEAPMMEPALDDSFHALMGWADEARDIGVRANADTLAEAQTARAFAAEGIGLCRTEHMFFDDVRMGVMREMIFADKSGDRQRALDRLLPMQRNDFVDMFRAMEGLPVTIRLFDPPLHEFLPSDREGLREMAERLDLPLSEVTRRVEAMTEFNPMLGLRGVRLGVTLPEIYNMQARAIFEATVEVGKAAPKVVPEIMIPLVTARREVELVKTRIEAVAAAVQNETGAELDFRVGVMVETPRAALRAGEIAGHSAFLSFGTNDLTQMTYGLSRDDAGRFMGTYVSEGVYPEDPFHRLDQDGVGELLLLGAERGRRARPELTLSICGEHAGDPSAIAFCRAAGFDYVSCSPFRVPIARLAAAHLALDARELPRETFESDVP